MNYPRFKIGNTFQIKPDETWTIIAVSNCPDAAYQEYMYFIERDDEGLCMYQMCPESTIHASITTEGDEEDETRSDNNNW